MLEQILNFPQQLSKGLELAKKVKIDKTYERVVICGMGGSAVAGELLAFWQETTGMPQTFYIRKDYDLPPWISKKDFIVCISWSGNTEETLSSYENARSLGIPTVSITTGGKLADLANQNKTPLILLPENNLKPRLGVGYMAGSLFQLMGLGEVVSKISLDADKTEAEGKSIAEKIDSNVPLLYSSYKWRIIPRFWKSLFNENDKIHAFWNYLPGMAHNELAGFTKRQETRDKRQVNNFYPIFFKDFEDDPRQNKTIDVAIAILNKMEYNYSIVDISNFNNPLEKVLNNYILGLWTTYYVAQKNGVNPEDNTLIESFKKLRELI